jgi:2-oxoglutarate dehydrogenase E2 component (dihydrolipoamide succinyltransferase)
MATSVIMPQLGESVVEGTITKWLKGEGESVEEYEPLLEINTDKVDTEIPAPATGTVLKLFIQEGQTVKAGTLLAVIGEQGEPLPETPADVVGVNKAEALEMFKAEPNELEMANASSELGFISPVVARIASEHDLDLSQIKGTGHGGRITKKDALAYVEAKSSTASPWEEPASGELFRPTEWLHSPGVVPTTAPMEKQTPEGGEIIELNLVREKIAEHMVRSVRTSPHVTTLMEADLSKVVAHREQNKARFNRDGVNLTFSAYIAVASVEALRAVPIVNSSWTEAGIQLHPAVNLGMAVSLGEQGLIVPVIHKADRLSLFALAAAINDLAQRARSQKLQPAEVQNGTFTITNHGVSGSLLATPIINQPQCAILGVGAIEKRVVVLSMPDPVGGTLDAIAIRPMVYLTLTFDHRILDGAVADKFLNVIVDKLQNWS